VRAGRGTHCDFCGADLDLGREFVYQVESIEFESNPMVLEVIRRLPDYYGEPLRFCRKCHDSVDCNRRDQDDEEQLRAPIDRASDRLLRWGLWVAAALAAAVVLAIVLHAICG
jgi:hypothetical protein